MLDKSTDVNNVTDKILQCFTISSNILLKCRHKGAIEGAGFSMGKLVNCITSKYESNDTIFQILYDSLDTIFKIIEKTDTTRRGAGFSIMIHFLVKNDKCNNRVSIKIISKIFFFTLFINKKFSIYLICIFYSHYCVILCYH